MTGSAQSEQISAEVLRLGLVQVREGYRAHNHSLFDGQLRMPLLEWRVGGSELGAWVGSLRALRLNEQLLAGPWGVLTEVLKHEMAHQYVDEVLGLREESAHGPKFREVCRARGIDARASGFPSGIAEDPAQSAILQRIMKLLSLAESDNQHEAEAATLAARRLMLKHNLDTAATNTNVGYTFRHVGRVTGRRQAYERVLATILADYFFVESIIVPAYRPLEGKRGSVLELCGSLDNLEMACYAHDFLDRAAEQLWRRHKKEKRENGDGARLSYLYGVMSGFREKLAADAEKNAVEGLVWLGDPGLGQFFRARHPFVRSVSGRGSVQRDAFAAGQEAGKRIVLARGMKTGSSGDGPRLLGSGGSR